MYEKIKENFVEFIIGSVLIAGLSYTVTTTYKTAIKIEKISKKLDDNEKTLKKIKITLATSKLNNKTLSVKDIENLISSNDKKIINNGNSTIDAMNDLFKIIAKEKESQASPKQYRFEKKGDEKKNDI